jgi:hypothetical protein
MVKTGIWPDDTSMPEMSDWLADLRDDGDAELPVGRHARPASARCPRPEPAAATAPDLPIAPVETIPPAEAMARDQARVRAGAGAGPRLWCVPRSWPVSMPWPVPAPGLPGGR